LPSEPHDKAANGVGEVRADFVQILDRLACCEEAIDANPFTCPVATVWYYEDVAALLAELRRANEACK
jgi:hypothetical protein